MTITFVKKYSTITKYKTKNWDTEHSFKYLFKFGDYFIEAGYFVHYKDNIEIKKVIELSSSYGCPFKCKHCASSLIEDFKIINSNIMMDVLDYIYEDNKIGNEEKVIVPITGIGDLYFTVKEVVSFINSSSIKYPNIVFDISTVLFNERIFNELNKINDLSKIRYFQLTFLHYDNRIKELVKIGEQDFKFSNTIELATKSKFKVFRINYIMVKDYNDNVLVFNEFISLIKPIKDKVSVRISRVNQTASSIANRVECGSVSSMEELSKLLTDNGIKNYIFYSERNDNMNCGQLIYGVEKENI